MLVKVAAGLCLLDVQQRQPPAVGELLIHPAGPRYAGSLTGLHPSCGHERACARYLLEAMVAWLEGYKQSCIGTGQPVRVGVGYVAVRLPIPKNNAEPGLLASRRIRVPVQDGSASGVLQAAGGRT